MRLMGEKKKRMRAPTCACSGIPITVPALNWLASVSLRIYGSPRAAAADEMLGDSMQSTAGQDGYPSRRAGSKQRTGRYLFHEARLHQVIVLKRNGLLRQACQLHVDNRHKHAVWRPAFEGTSPFEDTKICAHLEKDPGWSDNKPDQVLGGKHDYGDSIHRNPQLPHKIALVNKTL